MAFLVDDILLAPVKLVKWLGEEVQKYIEEEMTDEGKIQEGLMELQLLYEMEEINTKEYQKKEAQLLERLSAIRKYKEKEGRGILKGKT